MFCQEKKKHMSNDHVLRSDTVQLSDGRWQTRVVTDCGPQFKWPGKRCVYQCTRGADKVEECERFVQWFHTAGRWARQTHFYRARCLEPVSSK